MIQSQVFIKLITQEITLLSKLNLIIEQVYLFSNVNDCIDFIETVVNKKVFLIITVLLEQEILTKIYALPSVSLVFIYHDDNSQQHDDERDKRDDAFSKFMGIFTEPETLLKCIRSKIRLISRCETTTVFSLFSRNQKSTRLLSKERASFLWFQLLVSLLEQMPNTEQAKQEMISKCKEYYQTSTIELNKIEQFQTLYKSEDAIKWYTADCFLYKLINKALRTEDTNLLYLFRFYVIDLCQQLKQEQEKQTLSETIILYRGQIMPQQELYELQHNISIYIATNGFFSTTRDKKVALSFINLSNNANETVQNVLFEITVDFKIKNVVYADVAQDSQMEEEKEVLFNIGSIFCIDSVEFDHKLKLWIIQMSVVDNNLKDIQEHIEIVKEELKDTTPNVMYGRLLLRMGQYDKAENYFKLMIQTSSCDDHLNIASAYTNIGNVCLIKNDIEQAQHYYKHAYEIRIKFLPEDHLHIGWSLYNLGRVSHKQNNYDEALNYFQLVLHIYAKYYSTDNIYTARVLENMGRVYNDKSNANKTLDYLTRALEMYRRLFPAQHFETATALWNIGSFYKTQEMYDRALCYFERAQNMFEVTLPVDHPNHAQLLNDISITKACKSESELTL
ncbi:unnamed protein product [Didymodactylos carnosus]|uniref:ADP ribosyltransferase domain-containing protein n=1 Tax=Didymodactylos carnosus TaxID=1234261 RepID=A0A813ST01_9BILA|nr:unnamed protein product [Didymodactylos carnosus]CAF3589714.1 unnamed protein product [Didymodactylos carnosus]